MNVKIAAIVRLSPLARKQKETARCIGTRRGRVKSKGQESLEDDEKSVIYASVKSR